ncbi:hypothetical protein HK096_004735 [Nowakowskiella sp. JEL0078]|nr:hypothetical protein HK096_004735 [Nowakowskiella sp. JEL0078]
MLEFESKEISRLLVPPLSHSLHKGQSGRIGIVGGSEEYTGAPYFAGVSALKLGADLCHVFCEKSASPVIKSYSPDLIVHPYLQTSESIQDHSSSTKLLVQNAIVQKTVSIFPRLHALIVGPGLSRDSFMLNCAKDIINHARSKLIPIIIDAVSFTLKMPKSFKIYVKDGLYLVQQDSNIIKGYQLAILTPNANEFLRLCVANGISSDSEDAVEKLSKELGGVIIVQKGHVDKISNGVKTVYNHTEGSSRRCGGQGDILSGVLGTFISWALRKNDFNRLFNLISFESGENVTLLAACFAACSITRDCNRRAFEKYGRSMAATDMIEEIGSVFKDQFEI